MKKLLVAILLGASVLAVSTQAQQSESPLTNATVVKLVKAGFKEKTVIKIIHSRPNVFSLDPEQLIQLKRQGVSENIILAMLASQEGTFIAGDDDEWSADDPFFKGLKKPSQGEPKGESTNIFGSSGGSQSQTESRGGNGDSQNEGDLTGSATVRIVKPSVQPGGNAAPKLEKTPTLNNEGVIKLVEAGFSEGTIIKRIEESPVEFDLSPAKLDELFKRRVTDAIIAAMKKAMGDESRPK